ncbi:YraN family protein [Marivita sp. GX14005]|uniref:YraN family protein n=1 Tax=Marivita sp. GX14005 TaxID=2942276 RepID=UPI002019E5DD|nr:YraN family protein [Marivita sp. GX14005]MCL3881958.1 YraN family protein [Marivita sp. GX14005]
MPFDFETGPERGAKQRTNYYAGLNAEKSVQRHYQRQGAELREARWRGPGGEIDLILAEGERMVFVEVKKSRTHDQAAQRITARQMGRILRSAESYLGRCPKGSLTEARVDIALVDGQGKIEIIPNASMMF